MEYIAVALALIAGYVIGRSIKSGTLDVEQELVRSGTEHIKSLLIGNDKRIKLIRKHQVLTPEGEQLQEVEKELGTGAKE